MITVSDKENKIPQNVRDAIPKLKEEMRGITREMRDKMSNDKGVVTQEIPLSFDEEVKRLWEEIAKIKERLSLVEAKTKKQQKKL